MEVLKFSFRKLFKTVRVMTTCMKTHCKQLGDTRNRVWCVVIGKFGVAVAVIHTSNMFRPPDLSSVRKSNGCSLKGKSKRIGLVCQN